MKYFILGCAVALSLNNCCLASSSRQFDLIRSSAQTADLSKATEMLASVNGFWPSDPSRFANSCGALVAGLESKVKNSPESLALIEQAVSSLLEKTDYDAIKSSELAELIRNQRLAIYSLIGAADLAKASGEEQLRYAKLVVGFLCKVNEHIIPNYHLKSAGPNVMPPIPSGPIMAGMDPKAIKDVKARAAYEKAIQDNSANIETNKMQLALASNSRQISSFLIRHLDPFPKQFPALAAQTNDIVQMLEPFANAKGPVSNYEEGLAKDRTKASGENR